MKKILLVIVAVALIVITYIVTQGAVRSNNQMYGQEKRRVPEKQVNQVFARVTFTGRIGLDKANLEKLFNHLKTGIEDFHPTPPCEGAVLVSWQAGWEVIDGKTVFVDRITWRCPDGRLVVVTVIWE